jgi:arylsulfatase
MTEPFIFTADETADVGMEAGSPVSPDYGPQGNAFNGQVNWVEIDVDKEALDQDHLLAPEERFHVAMALQLARPAARSTGPGDPVRDQLQSSMR